MPWSVCVKGTYLSAQRYLFSLLFSCSPVNVAFLDFSDTRFRKKLKISGRNRNVCLSLTYEERNCTGIFIIFLCGACSPLASFKPHNRTDTHIPTQPVVLAANPLTEILYRRKIKNWNGFAKEMERVTLTQPWQEHWPVPWSKPRSCPCLPMVHLLIQEGAGHTSPCIFWNHRGSWSSLIRGDLQFSGTRT